MDNNDNNDIKKIIYRYILLNIQAGKWPPFYKIPSERSFAIRFNTSRSLIRSILKNFLINGVLISIEKKGHIVSNEWNSFLESDSRNYDRSILTKNIGKLNKNFIKLINESLKEHKLNEVILNCEFKGVKKVYFKNNIKQKEITHFLPNDLFDSSDIDNIKDSFLKYYGYAGLPIGKKIWFRLAPKEKNSSLNLKLIYSLDEDLIGIMIIKYFDKNRKIDIFSIENIVL